MSFCFKVILETNGNLNPVLAWMVVVFLCTSCKAWFPQHKRHKHKHKHKKKGACSFFLVLMLMVMSLVLCLSHKWEPGLNVHWITIYRNGIIVAIHLRLDRPLIAWILSCCSLCLAFKVLEIFFTITVSF